MLLLAIVQIKQHLGHNSHLRNLGFCHGKFDIPSPTAVGHHWTEPMPAITLSFLRKFFSHHFQRRKTLDRFSLDGKAGYLFRGGHSLILLSTPALSSALNIAAIAALSHHQKESSYRSSRRTWRCWRCLPDADHPPRLKSCICASTVQLAVGGPRRTENLEDLPGLLEMWYGLMVPTAGFYAWLAPARPMSLVLVVSPLQPATIFGMVSQTPLCSGIQFR
ncbi:hypothetical protein QBC44DRAFT_329459 [Cladorrhinum sp. PSN332]|nr:hypothetical protein QBC44DRAFT_329459 [Cladorrhinum sp. PSN332]